jgi:parvulin-like peptidyl-prolyl isomerase
MERHFQKHRRELDGTELRVGHVLFKPADPAVLADIKKLVEAADGVRSDVLAGKVTFEAAVIAHSAGTKKDGGDLGFIRRQGSMPEPFARAAFQLEKGQISQPVVSSFGVHLIRCTDERPGAKTLKNDDVADEVKLRLARQLFEEIAARERNQALAGAKNAGIKFTGNVPYLKPGTDELVLPRDP